MFIYQRVRIYICVYIGDFAVQLWRKSYRRAILSNAEEYPTFSQATQDDVPVLKNTGNLFFLIMTGYVYNTILITDVIYQVNVCIYICIYMYIYMCIYIYV